MSLSNLGGKSRKTAFFKMAAILQVNYSIIQITQKVLDGFSRNLAECLVPVQGRIGQILKKICAYARACAHAHALEKGTQFQNCVSQKVHYGNLKNFV